MANEITYSYSLAIKMGLLNESINRTAQKSSIVATIPRKSASVQNVGTTAETVTLNSDLGSPGFAFFCNYDTTNFVELGVLVSAVFYPVLRLDPKECQIVKLSQAVTLYAKANAAAVDLEVVVFSA